MTKREQVKKDAKIIDGAMMNYTGDGGAHFGFIVYESGERHFFSGGRVDLMGICLGEAIATMVNNTPGLGKDFIYMVSDVAHRMLDDMSEKKVQ